VASHGQQGRAPGFMICSTIGKQGLIVLQHFREHPLLDDLLYRFAEVFFKDRTGTADDQTSNSKSRRLR